MIQHPEIFAAAFPTCEYYLDSKISNKQIKELAKKPLWFTYAENDKTVKPKNNCIPTIERLREAGLQFSAAAPSEALSGALEGKTIVVSGNFSISRDAMKELIAAHGGKCASGVSGNTSFLLAGTKPGPEKLQKCLKLGIPVVSEQEFRSMLPAAAGGQEAQELTLF